MTWSYDPTVMLNFDFNTVRFFIGDTDSAYPQLQNEEITFTLEIRGDVYSAAAMCSQALAGKYSRLVNQSADGVSQQMAQKAAQYATLAREYDAKAAIYQLPYAGALSIADMRAVLANPDRVPDLFRFGMFDDPPNDGADPPTAAGNGSFDRDLTTFP